MSLTRWSMLQPRELILDWKALPTILRIAPSNNRSICQDCKERTICSMDLILDSGAITPMSVISPCTHRSIFQNSSKCPRRTLDLLHTPELKLDCRALTANKVFTPCYNRSISQDSSKCIVCNIELLHSSELGFCAGVAPCDDPVTSIAQPLNRNSGEVVSVNACSFQRFARI